MHDDEDLLHDVVDGHGGYAPVGGVTPNEAEISVMNFSKAEFFRFGQRRRDRGLGFTHAGLRARYALWLCGQARHLFDQNTPREIPTLPYTEY